MTGSSRIPKRWSRDAKSNDISYIIAVSCVSNGGEDVDPAVISVEVDHNPVSVAVFRVKHLDKHQSVFSVPGDRVLDCVPK